MNLDNFETKEMKNRKMKEHIFNVALSMMKQIGFENLTIRMICQEAEISTGMFYKHFSSKENLLAFYYDKAQEDFDSVINEQLTDLPIKDQLIQFYVWICHFTSDLGVDFCRNFFHSKNELMNTNLFNNKLIEITNKCIEDAVAKGFKLSPDRTPHKVSKDLCVMIKGIIFDWSAHAGSYDMAKFAEDMLTHCMEGLL
ncbi:MAG: TetR/AcrR family transcriptional regulator [Dorea sp.]|jgi:AcrR family transcriptional regulator|nr:TetR/AcrR family transcriptional regulator [Dorea sp.]